MAPKKGFDSYGQKIGGSQYTDFSKPTAASNSNAAAAGIGILTAINSITNAYSAYEAGKMREIAYNHEAAMAEINAKQIGIDAQFIMADKMDQLRSTLALQNVVAAATGRAGGSIQNLAQTSTSNLKREEERIRLTGKAKSVATMMDAASARAAGKSAASMGLLSAVGELTGGGAQAARFIS